MAEWLVFCDLRTMTTRRPKLETADTIKIQISWKLQFVYFLMKNSILFNARLHDLKPGTADWVNDDDKAEGKVFGTKGVHQIVE